MSALALLATLGIFGAVQDTVVARADNPPVWGADLGLVEEIRIGVLDGDEDYTLGRVVDVAVQPDGTIWIADALAHGIRRYDQQGRFIDILGRSGEGPGEFSTITGLERLPDGRMAAWDGNLARVSLFKSDGTVDKVFPLPLMVARMRGNIAEIFRADDLGRLYIFSPFLLPNDAAQFGWMQVDTSGAVLDTIPFPDAQTEGPTGGFKLYPFGRMGAFSVVTRGALSPDGQLVMARNSRYALNRPRSDGSILRIERSWDPVSVNRQEREEREALIAASQRGTQQGASIPDRKPPFWAFWVDHESRIWVARHAPAVRIPESDEERSRREVTRAPPSEWWEPLVLDVISPDGRYLGTVRIEDHQTDLRVARGRTIWVIEQGEFDEQYVVRYRIESG